MFSGSPAPAELVEKAKERRLRIDSGTFDRPRSKMSYKERGDTGTAGEAVEEGEEQNVDMYDEVSPLSNTARTKPQAQPYLGYPDPGVTGTSVHRAPFGRVLVEILLLYCHFCGNSDVICHTYGLSPSTCM